MSGRMVTLAIAVVAAVGQLASAPFGTSSSVNRSEPTHTRLSKLLLWNVSPSAPRGFYLLRLARPLNVGELVVVVPPEPLARFAAVRGYLPLGVPLLKHIAALGGQTVCRFADVVTVDGRAVAMARVRDTSGRPLSRWQGCRTLRAGQVFLLNSAIPDSFDGRYFGVLPANSITARAEPLWITPEP